MNNNIPADILEKILTKIEKLERNPINNGGYNKLQTSIEYIKEKQDEACEKVDKINEALYAPDTGFFARVGNVEDNTELIKEKIEEHTEQDEKFYAKIEKKIEETEPAINSIQTIKKITGDQFEHLQSAVKIDKMLQKTFWWIVAGAGSLVAKLVYEIITVYMKH